MRSPKEVLQEWIPPLTERCVRQSALLATILLLTPTPVLAQKCLKQVFEHFEVRLPAPIARPFEDQLSHARKEARKGGVRLDVYGRGYGGSASTTPSGDLLHVTRLKDGRISVFIGDAKGHDAEAIADSQRVRDYFGKRRMDSLFSGAADASTVLERLDQEMVGFLDDRHFALACLILDPRTGGLEYANAGLPFVKIRKPDGRVITLSNSGSYIGDSLVNYRSANDGVTRYPLQSGDQVLAMTDGIPDGMDQSGNPIQNRLDALIQKEVEIPALIQKQTDDETLVSFKWYSRARR